MFAVNHILEAAKCMDLAAPQMWTCSSLEHCALETRLGENANHLIAPGGNYDWAVLHSALASEYLQAHAMPPEQLEEAFAQQHTPWQDGCTVGYILRTPAGGGHWVALLPPNVVARQSSDCCAAVLCDSMHATPFLLDTAEVEDLLLGVAIAQQSANVALLPWAAFQIRRD